jgi:hypothetical protein
MLWKKLLGFALAAGVCVCVRARARNFLAACVPAYSTARASMLFTRASNHLSRIGCGDEWRQADSGPRHGIGGYYVLDGWKLHCRFAGSITRAQAHWKFGNGNKLHGRPARFWAQAVVCLHRVALSTKFSPKEPATDRLHRLKQRARTGGPRDFGNRPCSSSKPTRGNSARNRTPLPPGAARSLFFSPAHKWFNGSALLNPALLIPSSFIFLSSDGRARFLQFALHGAPCLFILVQTLTILLLSALLMTLGILFKVS